MAAIVARCGARLNPLLLACRNQGTRISPPARRFAPA
jgi:hypothetical protein